MIRPTIAAACIAPVLLCACQVLPPPALKEDPALAQKLLSERARLNDDPLPLETPEDATALEAVLEQNPEDLPARSRLLYFYRGNGRYPRPDKDATLARRRHLTWLITHHPDVLLLATGAFTVSRTDDPDGYAAMRPLWLAHTAKRDASFAVLDNAGVFFYRAEPEIAEELFLRMQALPQDASLVGTPRDPAVLPVWVRLTGLYAGALDADGSSPAATAYAARVRKTLDASRDATLLAGTASTLLGPVDRATTERDIRRRAIGMHYLNRAFEIDPRNRQAHYVRRNMAMNDRAQAMLAKKSGGVPDPARPLEPDGSSLLACLAEQEYTVRRFTKARAFAEDALRVAPTIAPDRSSCDAEFRANLVLASIEFTEGRRASAVDYLLAASRAPAPVLPIDTRPFPAPLLEGRLINSMLKNGERKSIIEYLERSAATRPPADAALMRKEAAAIRDGRMPERYQRALFEGAL